MTEQRNTFCRICEPACPIKASFDNSGKLTELTPNPDHPSGGTPCHKGLSFLDVHNSPDRLNWPLKRQNSRMVSKGEFSRVSWDDAFDDIRKQLSFLQREHGPNSIAFFSGNPGVFNSRGHTSAAPMIANSGSKMIFSSGTQDTTNKFRGAYDIYGARSLPFPDLENTNYLLCLGANPKISRWTLISQPNDSLDVLKQIKSRGGQCVFVNPRNIESSMPETGKTLLIKPGTDVYFLAAVINEIAKNDDIDQAHVAKHGKNLDQLLQFVSQYPAEKVSEVTGIDVNDIAKVAKDFAAADGAAAFMSTGIAQSGQGLLTHWLTEMLNFITANLGRKGGTFVSTSFVNKVFPVDVAQPSTFSTSIGELEIPPPGIALPSVILTDLIESGDIKALIVLSGNPLLTVGGESTMRKAFEKLDLVIATDIMLSATAELADYVLPATSWIERADINLICSDKQGGLAYVHYSDAMEAPVEDRKEDWWIIAKLAQALGAPSLLDLPEDMQQDGFKHINQGLSAFNLSIDKLKKMPQQTAVLHDTPYDDFYDRCVLHADKRVDCFPPSFQSADLLQRCSDIFDELEIEAEGVLKLVSLRTNYMHNSWLTNVERLRKGTLERNPLHMSPTDAYARNLFDGDEIRVFNEHGSVQTVLHVSDEIRSGAVAMTHGYTSESNPNLAVASAMRGANCNQLMPAGADSFEPLSNMSRLSAVPVQVEKR